MVFALLHLLAGCEDGQRKEAGRVAEDSGYACDTSAEEVYYDGRDNDCDPQTRDNDQDRDGYAASALGGPDCDDTDASINPEAREGCDGVDEDCDGLSDDQDAVGAVDWYADADGDGFGDPGASQRACRQPTGYVENAFDCDDADPGRYPLAEEVCEDGVVNDCASTEAEALAGCGWSGDVALARADATLVGEAAGDQAGWSVAGAGDVDGDGVPDLAIGAPSNAASGVGSGVAYVVSGATRGTLSLARAAAMVPGEYPGTALGVSVAGPGDVDGDGYADLLLGAPGTHSGTAYVVSGPLTGATELGAARAELEGESGNDQAAWAVAGAGDVDGDGLGDLVVGAPYKNARGTDSGKVYLLSGLVTGRLELSLAQASFVPEQERGLTGAALSGGGDADGDGLADLIFGAPHHRDGVSVSVGAAYVASGLSTGGVSLDDALAAFLGETAGDEAGDAVAWAGDTDGDGHDDLVLGAPGAGPEGAGNAYLVRGPITGFSPLGLSDARIEGTAGEGTGGAVAAAGDLDGDGLADLLLGASGDGLTAAWLVSGLVSGTVSVEDARARYLGEDEGDGAGQAVAAAGDVDGDGLPDLLIGAPADAEGGSEAGAGYLLLCPGYNF